MMNSSRLLSRVLNPNPRFGNANGAFRSKFQSRYNHNNYNNYNNRKGFSTETRQPNSNRDQTKRYALFGAGIVGGVIGYLGMQGVFADDKDHQVEEDLLKTAGARKDGLPEYTLEEVAKHKTIESRIWVVYKNGVYDITEFIEMHPGQDKILMAAGGSIEPFWALYSQHFIPEVLSILEELRIGNLTNPAPSPSAETAASSDPYASDPKDRSPVLVVRSQKPFNAEVPTELIAENLITPNELFFIRNHLPVPKVDPKTYVLEISTDFSDKPIRFTLDELKNKFKKYEVMATIQCAGNRRNEMTRYKEVKGGFWETGAISNATWSGVRLRDVLIYSGLNPDNLNGIKHVQFVGLDKDFEKSYGASIPVEKAISDSGDVLLAFEMNGKELPLDHGYPVRVVVPGVVGARNVKWVHKIHASKDESTSHWQQKDYKGFSPNVDWHNVDWDSAPAIQDYPVQSAIALPKNGTVLPGDTKEVTVKGFAWSGGGRGIIRVDVSVDGGITWHTANLVKPDQPPYKQWAWSLWNATVPVPEGANGKLDIVCKAVDSSYNTQPERVEPIWNLRGVLSNAWHKVNVKVNETNK